MDKEKKKSKPIEDCQIDFDKFAKLEKEKFTKLPELTWDISKLGKLFDNLRKSNYEFEFIKKLITRSKKSAISCKMLAKKRIFTNQPILRKLVREASEYEDKYNSRVAFLFKDDKLDLCIENVFSISYFSKYNVAKNNISLNSQGMDLSNTLVSIIQINDNSKDDNLLKDLSFKISKFFPTVIVYASPKNRTFLT